MDWQVIDTESEGNEITITVQAKMALEEYQAFRENNKTAGSAKPAKKAKPKEARKKRKPRGPDFDTAKYNRERYLRKKAEKAAAKAASSPPNDDISDKTADKVQAIQDKIDKLEEEMPYEIPERE